MLLEPPHACEKSVTNLIRPPHDHARHGRSSGARKAFRRDGSQPGLDRARRGAPVPFRGGGGKTALGRGERLVDSLSPRERSERMRLIKSRDTKPELKLRSLVWALGYRYRIGRGDVPGKPDLAFIGRRQAMFVHGCFWHRHDCPMGVRVPRSRVEFWAEKFRRNLQRDAEVQRQLKARGWRSLVIWECELQDRRRLERRVKGFLSA
jgi:DNA mismatch endonuclease, patch repair protein